jgi:hypothetical protein
MLKTFQLRNNEDETKTLTIEHCLSLEKCDCTTEEENECIFYCVGYSLDDLCTSLGLDKTLPIYQVGQSDLRLEVINSDGPDGFPGIYESVLLVPVHKTTPSIKMLRN